MRAKKRVRKTRKLAFSRHGASSKIYTGEKRIQQQFYHVVPAKMHIKLHPPVGNTYISVKKIKVNRV